MRYIFTKYIHKKILILLLNNYFILEQTSAMITSQTDRIGTSL